MLCFSPTTVIQLGLRLGFALSDSAKKMTVTTGTGDSLYDFLKLLM